MKLDRQFIIIVERVSRRTDAKLRGDDIGTNADQRIANVVDDADATQFTR